jgi:molybdopterin-guanine dinucleotide biosynthesis protein A
VAPLSAAILAGGPGARVRAEWSLDGQPLVVHVARRLARACREVFVVAKDVGLARYGLRVVADLEDLQHPLVGLVTALRSAASDRCFVCTPDMPFVEPALVEWLAQEAQGADVVLPVLRDGPQPLHAVYTRPCAAVLGEMAVRGEALWRFLRGLRVRTVPEEALRARDLLLRSFFTVDDPVSLDRARRWLSHDLPHLVSEVAGQPHERRPHQG